MADETQVEAPVAVQEPVAPAGNDPFTLDEVKLSSLSPEQRAALDPIFDEWKTRAKGELERSSKTYTEKYKPLEEKAQALDHLVKDPRFVQWWNNLQQAAQSQGAEPPKMQDFATPEEWQQAVADAYGGNGTKMAQIQARMWSAMATPVVQELKKSQQELKDAQEEFRQTQEMKELFESHSDAKELDAIGRDPKDPTSESLLEMCLEWADKNGKSLEDGYRRARGWADALKVNAQQKALGLVQDKKASTTSGPSTITKSGGSVIEVADNDELLQRNMEALAESLATGSQAPLPKFVIRQGATNNGRWAQR